MAFVIVETSAMAAESECQASGGVLRLFLCGDVMTGRGIDQILPHPCAPQLHEPWVTDARYYWELAERAHGQVPRPTTIDYVWGDALEEWQRMAPDVGIANLETAITTSDDWWPGKEIHYRMSPQNIGCLQAARIDCYTLANNHVLDWGYEGLREMLDALRRAGLQSAGAGRDRREAAAPAILIVGSARRVLVFAFGSPSAGIPLAWGAAENRAGVNLLPDFSTATVRRIASAIGEYRRRGDVVVVSVHWGGNWGHEVPAEQRRFAWQLIDRAGVDIVHGHSSHHVKAIEIYQKRLILYGCGDFLTDYEGICGYEPFRGDLALMYFATVESSSGSLVNLEMIPLQMRRMQLRHVEPEDRVWLQQHLDQQCAPFGTRIGLCGDRLTLLPPMPKLSSDA